MPKPDGRSTVAEFDHTNDTLGEADSRVRNPGRPTHVHVRVELAPNQQFALLFTESSPTPGRADRLLATSGRP